MSRSKKIGSLWWRFVPLPYFIFQYINLDKMKANNFGGIFSGLLRWELNRRYGSAKNDCPV